MTPVVTLLALVAAMVPFAILIWLLRNRETPVSEERQVRILLEREAALRLKSVRMKAPPPAPKPPPFPATVVELAQALVNGEDCAFALHDALIEAGLLKYADLFKKSDFQRGHWIIDRILHSPA